MSANRGDLDAAAAALRSLESLFDRRFRFYREAPHHWFSAAGTAAWAAGELEDAATLVSFSGEYLGAEMNPMWTWHLQQIHVANPRWQAGAARRVNFEDACKLAARSLDVTDRGPE